MGSQHVSFQLPSEVIEAIESEAQKTGQSETAVVLKILTQAFVCPQSVSSDIPLKHLQRQLNDLQVQIHSLSGQLQEQFLMQLDSDISAAIRSLPTEERSAWMSRVLIEAEQREWIQPAISLDGSVDFVGENSQLWGQIASQN